MQTEREDNYLTNATLCKMNPDDINKNMPDQLTC